MRKHEELVKQIKDFVSKNKTGQAIKLLAKEQLSDIDKELIILNSRYSKLSEEKRLGIIDGDSAQRQLNKINFDLLALMELIEERAASPQASVPVQKTIKKEATVTKTINNQGSNDLMKYLMIGAGLLLAAVLGYWGFANSQSDSKDNTKPPVVVTENPPVEVDPKPEINSNPTPPVEEEPEKPDKIDLEPETDEVSPFTPILEGEERSEQIYIGNHFEGGTIIYIDTINKFGLVMATSDALTEEIKWLDRPFDKARANQTALFKGKSNTKKLVEKFGEGLYPAKVCADFVDEGFDDWYLPSKDELDLMYDYNNHKGFKHKYYWSSTEIADKHVYYKSFFNGRSYQYIPTGNPKNFSRQNKGKIRPVRRFTFK